jgi:large subunit ribosomal protein L10
MKTRAQKETELARARELFDKSQALIFADFTKITAEDLRKLRIELKKADAKFLVVKKRILGILLKEKGIDVDLSQFKTSVGTIFSEADSEHIAGPAFKFFSGMEIPEGGAKDMWIKKLLAGYDLKGNLALDADQIIYIGKLPPREVVLAQFLGMLAAPIRSFLYILQQKSQMAPAITVVATPAAASAPAAAAIAIASPETSAPGVSSAKDPDPITPTDTNPDSDTEQKVELTQAQ